MESKLATLTVYEIKSEKDISVYRDFLNQIDPDNPYYKIELLNVTHREDQRLLYFIYTHEGEPNVLMPFYIRPIVLDGEVTSFFDVISPWGYTGPLYKGGITQTVAEAFWMQVDNWYQEKGVITEFVRFNFNDSQKFYSGTAMHTLKNVRGRIREEEVLWNSFKRNVRKNVNNAMRHELSYEMYHEQVPAEKIEEFYKIYIGTMNRHSASETFYHSQEYFANFIKRNPQHCALAMVYKDDKAISTELLLLSGDTMFSFLGGTDAEFFAMRPNDFLKIKTLNWARDKGFSYYVVGGGLSDGDGLYQYKKKFFPEDPDLNFYTGRKILNPEIYWELTSKAQQKPISEMDQEADITEGFFPRYRDI